MIHLRSVGLVKLGGHATDGFPFDVPVIRALETLEFSAPVTFFVGENGSGKSTLLEAIASAADSITVGSENIARDPSLAPIRALAKRLKLIWQKRTKKGFFLRAEDFFGYARRLARMRAELEQEASEAESEYKGRSETALALARMPYMRELHALKTQYGRELGDYSHGESFLSFFQARFVPGGLYLLDEPEAPLSPLRQLAFLFMLKQMSEQDAQFIIATHSPIIMAFPGATILSFDHAPIQPAAYQELEHVAITRAFLNNPEQYLKHL
ncbi:MAG: AAA family ATPase [Chloroflexi bacterium]|nr:AAA family ATPase [Chloroflexota bacterium]